MALHEELGETLAALDLCGRPGRAEDGILALLEFVDKAGHERHFGPNNGEVWADTMGDLEHGIHAADVAGQTLGLSADTAIAGHAIELRDPR